MWGSFFGMNKYTYNRSINISGIYYKAPQITSMSSLLPFSTFYALLWLTHGFVNDYSTFPLLYLGELIIIVLGTCHSSPYRPVCSLKLIPPEKEFRSTANCLPPSLLLLQQQDWHEGTHPISRLRLLFSSWINQLRTTSSAPPNNGTHKAHSSLFICSVAS